MTYIELTDQQAALLKARAASEGLGLQAWLRKLAKEDGAATKPRKSAYGLLAQFGPGPTAEEIDDNRREFVQGFAEDFE